MKIFINIFKYLFYFFLIILIVIFIDLIINLIIPEKISKSIGITRNYSLKSEVYHHEIAPNINLNEFWGSKKYKVRTNEFGMRISNSESQIVDKNKEYIGLVGDSFVYGSGIEYENHFINSLKNVHKNLNFLNLGYVSYSPSIYFKKIQNYIDDHKINFSKIYLFIDHSDIQDEGIFYREDGNGNIVRAWKTDSENKSRIFKHKIKNYFQQNSFTFKFFQILTAPSIPNKSLQCLQNQDPNINFSTYLKSKRYGHSFIDEFTKLSWVNKGRKKTITYLNKISELSKKYNFELILVYYPSALEILSEIELQNSNHYKLLYDWTKDNKIKFLDTKSSFNKYDVGKKNYMENFILCDVHWNKTGHKIIAENLIKSLNE